MKTRLLFRNRILVFCGFAILISLVYAPWNGFTFPIWLSEVRSGEVVHNVNTTEKIIALTFDDGPDPTCTPPILDTLKQFHASATFFMMGKMVRKYPDLALRVRNQGNEIGNHTETHPYLERLSMHQVDSEFDESDEVDRSVLGSTPTLFRPPRGAWNPTVFKAAESRHQRIILWSVSLEHKKFPKPKDMVNRALNLIRPGDIILMHDGAYGLRKSTVEALPLLVSALQKQGYRFVTVSELLRQANVPVHN